MDGQQQRLPFLQSFSDLQQFNCSGVLSKPLQRKLDTLLRCNINDAVSPLTVMQLTLSVAHRAVNDLAHYYQVEQHSAVNIWAAVRSHGCQFLGPAMQEDVLKLILLALEDGSCLSRKVLVMFVVQRLQLHYPQASKTAVGHVVQLLYRASCFHVMKRDEESSLMQLKEEFRNYESLRCHHDAQIVEISLEFGLRILPEQWSCLLYGDASHKPHMQSIVDKLSKKPTFAQSTDNLLTALKRSSNLPEFLDQLKPRLDLLNSFQQSSASAAAPPASVSLNDIDSCLNIVVHLLTLLASLLQQRPAHRCDSNLVSQPRRCIDRVNQAKNFHEIDSEFSKHSSAENSVTLSCDANNRKAVDQTSIWSLSEVSSRADRDTEQRSFNSTGTCNLAVTANTLEDGRFYSRSPVGVFSDVGRSLSTTAPSDFSVFQGSLFTSNCSFPHFLYPQQNFFTLPVSSGEVYTPITSGNFCQLSMREVHSSSCLQPLSFPDDFRLSTHL